MVEDLKFEVTLRQDTPFYFTLLINDIPWKRLHRSLYGRRPRLPRTDDVKKWKEEFRSLELGRVKSYIIWLLTRKSYHSQELLSLLKLKFVEREIALKIISELENKGILNDALWVEHFVKRYQKKYCFSIIAHKLRLKAISEEEIEFAKKNLLADSSEEETILLLLKTRYRSKKIEDPLIRKKVTQSLLRRGFSLSVILNVINENLTN